MSSIFPIKGSGLGPGGSGSLGGDRLPKDHTRSSSKAAAERLINMTTIEEPYMLRIGRRVKGSPTVGYAMHHRAVAEGMNEWLD